MRRSVLVLLALSAIIVPTVIVSGCLDRDLRPLNPCVVSGFVRRVKATNIDKVDVLFMVDNSNSMAEEQASLLMQFPRLVSVLASGDINADGVQEFPPVNDLHVGVVSSDMGVGGFTVPTCAGGMLGANFGDDGILRTQGNASVSGCMSTYPRFLQFTRGDPVAQFAMDFGCVAGMGTGGCGFEQQLEAILKAITPSSSSITFNMGTVGHADVENSGFVRPDSLLAIILVSDEEDCSAIDTDIFNPSSTRYSGDLNLRCFMYPEAVHPVTRFVDGLLESRPANPDLLVFAAIVGVPTETVSNPESISYQAILDHPMMVERVDPAMPTRLVPSCNVPGRGIAFPPRRIVSVAQQLDAAGSNAVVQSICQADFSPALNAIIAKIADVLGGACLPRPLNPDESGRVPCDVVEVLPLDGDFVTCSSLASIGRIGEPIRLDRDDDGLDHEVCRVCQVQPSNPADPPAGTFSSIDADPRCAGVTAGWYYDNQSTDVTERCMASPQRIAFTPDAQPRTNVTVRLECLQSVAGGGTAGAVVQIGSPCTPPDDGPCTSSSAIQDVIRDLPGATPFCEPNSRTCQIRCDSNAQCPGGFQCDVERGAPFCQNPVCPI